MIIPGILLVLVGIAGILSVHHLKQTAGKILSQNYRSIKAARSMQLDLSAVQTGFLAEKLEIKNQAELLDRIEQSLRICEDNITVSGESMALSDIRARWNSLRAAILDRSSPLVVLQHTKDLSSRIDSLVLLNEEAMFSYERQTSHLAQVRLWGLFTATALAIAALAGFSLFAAGKIAHPIVSISSQLHRAINPESTDGSQRPHLGDELALLEREVAMLLQRLDRYDTLQQKRLQDMQNRLAVVINEVLEGLVLIDSTGTIMAVNRVAAAILGINNERQPCLSQLPLRDDVRAALQPLLVGTIEPERDLGELRYDIDNAERIYRPRAVPLVGGDAVEGHLIVFWDVTEQRRFEESRRKFISMLSHQLKTPMTSLSMAVNLLRESLGHVNPAQSELLTIATQDCSSIAALISDLIEAARDPAPDLRIRRRYLDLSKLLRTSLRPLVPQAEDKGIALIVPDASPMHAWVDPVKFPWVVTNIAGNALRYTPPGGTIDVKILRYEGEFSITIADTGSGIPSEKALTIFEPYVSLDRDPQESTHGLGLAIAKEIVEAHRGSITVSSALGKGTTFHITVPFDGREVS